MDRSGELNNAFASLRCSWNPDFNKKKPPRRYQQENRSCIQDVNELTNTERDDVIKLVMQGVLTKPYSHQVDLVARFFEDADLHDLKNGVTGPSFQPDSLLDDREPDLLDPDRNMDEQAGLCRPQKGPLSPHQLYMEL